MRLLKIIAASFFPLCATAQVGEHRNDFAFGVHGGVTLNTINFLPKVNQKMYQGYEGGIMFRYTCEKYFSTICSIQAEINYARIGWNEDILDINDAPVPSYNPASGTFNGDPEYYKRHINYIQVPILAHLAWGKEHKGVNFFFNAGPQFGIYQSESTDTNFSVDKMNISDRVSTICAQDTMAVENKFDYGIAAGLGIEAHIKHIGRFQLEARYYYGLGNIYGDSKRDYFGTSAHGTITIRAAYLLDI